MKNVLLSHDDKMSMYSVPDIVSDHLDKYCLEFCSNWIWKNPNGIKLLQTINGTTCAVYEAQDFIDYLNEWIFPEQKSSFIIKLDFYDYEIPKKYEEYPHFNF